MKFARVVFTIASVYGLLVLMPLYFLKDELGRKAPPAITHAEFYYGFIGLAVLFQFFFLLIAFDPIRYLPLMPIAILEKLIYTVPVVLLYLRGQVHPNMVPPALVDPIFGILFLVAYLRTAKGRATAGTAD
jgi:hypothetical protein